MASNPESRAEHVLDSGSTRRRVSRNDPSGQSKFTLNSYARSPPTSVSFSAAPSGLAPGGRPSRSNKKRLTPGGPCSSSFGTGSAQSGVGPSTNRLTSLASGAATSTSTPVLPSRLTSRMVSGLGSPMVAGFGTASSAADSVESSVLAPRGRAGGVLPPPGSEGFSHPAYLLSARTSPGLWAFSPP